MASAMLGVPASNLSGSSVHSLDAQADGLDHVAAAQEGGHGLKDGAAGPEDADAGGSQHFVAGKGQEVGINGADVDRQVGHALGAVDQEQGAGGVNPAGDVGDGVDGAQDVGHAGDAHELDPLAVGGQQAIQIVEEQPALGVEADELEPSAGGLGQELPGDEVGVVLHLGQDDDVVLADVGPAPGVGDQVDGLGGVADKDDFARAAGVDEAADLAAGVLVGLGGLFGQGVDAAVDVGVVAPVVVVHGLDDRLGFLGGGGVVQVDQGLAVDLAGQDGKVGADGL